MTDNHVVHPSLQFVGVKHSPLLGKNDMFKGRELLKSGAHLHLNTQPPFFQS